MELTSKSKKIFFSIIIAIVLAGIFFVYYFYRQVLNSPGIIFFSPAVRIENKNPQKIDSVIDINLNLLNTNKFRNLRSDSLPVDVFLTGKRNPFQP